MLCFKASSIHLNQKTEFRWKIYVFQQCKGLWDANFFFFFLGGVGWEAVRTQKPHKHTLGSTRFHKVSDWYISHNRNLLSPLPFLPPPPSTAGHQNCTWRLEDKWAAASRGNCEETKDQLAAGTSTPTSP